MGIALGLLGTVTPMMTGMLFDSAIPQADRFLVLQIVAALFLVALMSSAFSLTQGVASLRVQSRMDYGIQAALWDRMLEPALALLPRLQRRRPRRAGGRRSTPSAGWSPAPASAPCSGFLELALLPGADVLLQRHPRLRRGRPRPSLFVGGQLRRQLPAAALPARAPQRLRQAHRPGTAAHHGRRQDPRRGRRGPRLPHVVEGVRPHPPPRLRRRPDPEPGAGLQLGLRGRRAAR